MANMFAMLKKAQEVQKGLQSVQAELAETQVTGQAGNGLVEVTMMATHDLVNLRIKPEAVDTADMGMLEDLVKVAFTDALAKANELTKTKMAAVTGGLGIPGF